MVRDYSRLGKIGSLVRWKKFHSSLRLTSDLSKDKAAINAYLCGDGNISVRKDKNSYEMRFYMDDSVVAQRIVNLFEKEFNAFPKITKIESKIKNGEGYFLVRLNSKPIAINLLSLGNYGHLKWNVPTWIKNELEIEWIKCFFDCEAYVNVKKRQIQLKSVGHEGLMQVKTLLKNQGILPKLYGPYKQKGENQNPYFFLIILGKDDIKRYAETIGFYHSKKASSLAELSNLVNL